MSRSILSALAVAAVCILAASSATTVRADLVSDALALTAATAAAAAAAAAQLLALPGVIIIPGPITPTDIPLGSCQNFAVHSGAAITGDGRVTTIHTGSIGVAPGTSITGNLQVSSGTVELNSNAAINCAGDKQIAYDAAKGAACNYNMTFADDLSGTTLVPGVYCTSGMFTVKTGTVTLNAQLNPNAQFLFQSATSLITSTGTSFILQNGAREKNVFWQLGSSGTIALSSSFAGSILAYAAVTVDHDASVVGRLFGFTAVTFAGGDSVTLPTSD